MSAEMRLIGDPAELSAIEEALKPAVIVSSSRRYPSRRSGDELRYFRVSLLDREHAEPSNVIRHLKRVVDLDVRMDDQDGNNHIFVAMDFVAPGYVDQSTAARLNKEIQSAIRRIINPCSKDVWLRFDQSFKPSNSGIVLYHSGKDWITVPYSGLYPLDDDPWGGGDD